jgi:hypothetical protein
MKVERELRLWINFPWSCTGNFTNLDRCLYRYEKQKNDFLRKNLPLIDLELRPNYLPLGISAPGSGQLADFAPGLR